MSLKKIGIAIFLFNLVIKSLFINTIPPILQDSEIYYATEAKSIIESGSDVTGKWNPLSFSPANPNFSELTGTIIIPGFLLFPNDVFLAIKFMSIIFGSLLPILLALISFRITNNKGIFITTAIIATINPWLFQFSRMSFDSLYSSFFFFLGIVMLLYLKNWQCLWSLLPFFIGFYQYQGHKPILILLVLITVLYLLIEKKQIKKIIPQILLAIIVLIFFLIHLWRLPQMSSSIRLEKEMFFDKTEISKQVNLNRRLTLENPLPTVFDNKYLLMLREVNKRFFASLDLKWLFVEGDARVDTFSVTNHGFFHLLDIILILASFLYKKKSAVIYLSAIALVGTIPNLLKNEEVWITFRSSIMFLGLVMLSGIGAYNIIVNRKKRLLIFLISLYLLFSAPFFYQYFFRYPITSTKDTFFYDRILANYIKRHSEDKQFLIYAQAPKMLFDSLVTYNKLITKDNLQEIHQAYKSDIYKINNITISGECLNLEPTLNPDVIVIADYRKEKCEENLAFKPTIPGVQIASLIDSGARYLIYNDDLCRSFELNKSTYVKTNIFDIEKISPETFCLSFFTSQ